jgi:ATP/maltotriose-dependent transcriptional regulator MalT
LVRFLALCLGSLGRWMEAQALLEQLRARLRGGGDAAGLNVTALVHYLAVANLADDRELAASLRESLAPVASQVASISPVVIARHLGAASTLLGEREQARAYFEEALEVAGKVRFRPEVALTRLELAELLLGDGDQAHHAEALEHLDFAIAEFREMKMQPSLERALRHKDVLKA